MKIRFCGRATTFLWNLREENGDGHARWWREGYSLSLSLQEIDLNSKDGIRSFSIKIGRIHASHEFRRTRWKLRWYSRPIRSALRRKICVYLSHRVIGRSITLQTMLWIIVTHQLFRCRAQRTFLQVHYESRARQSRVNRLYGREFPDKMPRLVTRIGAAIHASALGRGTIETGSDLRDTAVRMIDRHV